MRCSNQTKQRTDGLGWWVVGASVAFWVGIGVLMQAVGAYRFEVEGKFVAWVAARPAAAALPVQHAARDRRHQRTMQDCLPDAAQQ
jgi:hypothetical protein